ncbi:hypothetical protein [Neorhizobium sp. DAR64862/K0K3]|uniref:hypothetical protein n=1 Tax=Neorhizobium sp. DAR64862/K0K3 TaxID=3421957 RepID=UPI003D2BA7ED
MANKERGEVGFEAAGKPWTMKIGTGAMCEIEAETGKSISEVGQALNSEKTASLTLMRAVFWGALQQHHDAVTIRACNDLIDELGVQRVGELIGEAFQLAFPQKQPGTNKDAGSRPRKATAA